jgi:hypothetical protein
MKKKVLLLTIGLISLLHPNKTNGQAALLALLFGDQVASEDFNLSLEAGGNFNDYQNHFSTERKLAINFGIAGNIKLSEKLFLSPSIYFLSNRKYGFDSHSLNTGTPSLDQNFENSAGIGRLSYIDIPIFLRYKINKFRVGLAPQLSILNSSKLIYEGEQGNFEQDISNLTNNLDYGIMASINYEFLHAMKGKGLFIELRYYYGLTDVFKDQISSDFNRSSYFALHISLPFITEELAAKNLKR